MNFTQHNSVHVFQFYYQYKCFIPVLEKVEKWIYCYHCNSFYTHASYHSTKINILNSDLYYVQ